MSVDALIQEAGGLLQRGQRDAAIAALQRAVQLAPEHPIANQWLGGVYAQVGKFDEAAACLEVAVRSAPGNAGLWLNLGMMRSTVGNLPGAEAALRKAIDLDGRLTDAHLCLGLLLANQQKTGEADGFFRRASELAPGRADLAHTYSRVLADSGRIDEALAIVRAAQAQSPRDPLLQDKVCCLLNYIETDGAAILREHQKYGELLGRPPAAHHITDKSPNRRLRVGFLSGDLREHSVSYFLESLLEHRDPASLEVVCYHVGPPDERTTPRLRSKSDLWRHLFPVADDALRNAIIADNVDVLIELAGHAQGNRLTSLAAAAAPVQMTYIGYPNTTGVPSIGYRIVDSRTDPPGSERFTTERLIRLDGCFLCYRPFDDAPDVELSPDARPVTFGSFNNLAKLSARTIDAWGKILAAVTGSQLLLKGKGLGDSFVSARLLSRLAASGVSADRVRVHGHTPTTREHLEAYSHVGVALDPFPYHGTTTTCEAMWMGVPVVTLAGELHAQRVGVSLLETVGTPELIANDEAAYIDIATRLASDRSRLSEYRATLRERMRSSRLCDGPAHARQFEAAIRSAWQEWCGPSSPAKGQGMFGKLFGKR